MAVKQLHRIASVAVLQAVFMLMVLLTTNDPENSMAMAADGGGDCKNVQHYVCEEDTCSPDKCQLNPHKLWPVPADGSCKFGQQYVCSQEAISLLTYIDQQCTMEIENTEVLAFDTCEDKGGIYFLYKYKEPERKEQPIGQWWELTPDEYRARFQQSLELGSEQNPLGYGPNNRFVPPLYKAETLLSELDRHMLLLGSFPWIYVSNEDFLQSLWNEDMADFYWYNNDGASGSQLYPTGLSKYFDLYSFDGLYEYFLAWMWIWLCTVASPLTLFIPLDIWVAIFNGLSWSGLWKILMPALLHYPGEREWPLF